MTNVPFINKITNELSKRKLKSDVVANAILDIAVGNNRLDNLIANGVTHSDLESLTIGGLTTEQTAAIEKIAGMNSSASEIDDVVNPKWKFIQGFSPIEDFSGINGWNVGDTGIPTISSISDIGNVWSDKTLSIASTVSGGNIDLNKTGFTPFSILQTDFISLFFYLDNISNVGSIDFRIFSGTKRFSYNIRTLMSGATNEWHHIKIKISDMTITNGMTKKDLIDKIAVQTYGSVGKITTFKLAGLRLDNIQKPTISFTFDDNNLSDYTVAYSKMKQYGYVGTCYTISTAVGIAGRTNVSQMLEMQSDGWIFGIHGSDALNWVSDSTLSQAEVRIKTCRDWLYDNGFIGKGLKSCAYPQGQYNNDVINILKKLGITQARSTILQQEYYKNPSNYKLRGKEFSSSFETNKAYIDEAIKNGGSLVFICHNLSEAGYTESFNKTIDYIYNVLPNGVDTIENVIQNNFDRQ